MRRETAAFDLSDSGGDVHSTKRLKLTTERGDDEIVGSIGATAIDSKANFGDDTKNRKYQTYTLRSSILAHERGVSAAKFSPDGRYLATSSADRTVKIWTRTGKLIESLHGHTKGISDVSWSWDSSLLVSSSDDLDIRVWSVANFQAIRVFRGHTNFVLCSQFNRAGNLIASGSFDESIRIWDVLAGTCLRTIPAHSDPVASVGFNLDGTMLVSCSHDGLIRIWDTASGQCLKTLVDQDSPPVSFANFSPNGRFLLSCTLDSTIRLWNFVSSTPLKTYKGHKNTKYNLNAAMSNDQIVVGGEDGKVTIWDTQTKCVQQVIDASAGVAITVSGWTELNGTRWLVVGDLNNNLRIYNDIPVL